MDTLQLPKKREKVADKEGEVKDSQPTRQQQSPTSATSPPLPSPSSSPSHEFSFTISLHPSSTSTTNSTTTTTTTTTTPDKTKSQPSSFAIDLSPADDIFFHGHLLPLHLLSHLPISSPRSSTNSFESFNLPIKDILEDCKPNSRSSSSSSSNITTSINSSHSSSGGTKGNRSKLKSLSLFGLSKWQKGSEKYVEAEDETEKKKKMRKIRFDVGHILKRYVRMVRPLLLFSSGRKEKHQFLRQQPHSFSGNLTWRGNTHNCKQQEMRWGRRRGGGGGQFSAPASMRTSPSNSGLLATEILPSQTSDSTMEELHNAIQAAIAHCKNSISMKEEKLNS